MKLASWILAGLVISTLPLSAAPTTNDAAAPAYRLTAELRDGSRVVSTGAEKDVRFHSALFGDFQVAIPQIRTVDCGASNTATLLTTNGDRLAVSFVDADLPLKTTFGKIDVAVAQLRKLTVSLTGGGAARLPGLVALWSGASGGKDLAGSNDAELTDVTFADSDLGTAFSLDDGTIKVPGSSSLNVGLGDGFTICAWIKPADVSKNNPIFEWVQDGFPGGTQFYIYPPNGGPGSLYAMVSDINGVPHYFSSPRVVVPNVFQHVAFTYDRASGMGRIYCNGVLVAQRLLGNVTAQTGCDLYIGKRPLIHGETYQFTGLLNWAAIYNRALSAAELRQICTEENNGEPPPPPAVSSTPGIRGGFFED